MCMLTLRIERLCLFLALDTTHTTYIMYSDCARLPSMHKLSISCGPQTVDDRPPYICVSAPVVGKDVSRRDSDSGASLKDYPVLVITITVIQVIVFMYIDPSLLVLHIPLTRPENDFFVPRLFTYALVHANRLHLLSNLFVQIVAGVLIETSLGSYVFASVYLTGIVGGVLAEAATLDVPSGYSMVTVVGASCGIYALLLTGLAYVLINYRETLYANYIVALYFALILFEVTISILNPVANVSYVGHAVGAVYGFATGVVVVPNHYKLPWERTLRLTFRVLVPLSLAILLTLSLLR